MNPVPRSVKFARFGPKEGEAPKGGTCLSSFAVVRKDGQILVGKIGQPEVWADRWELNLQFPARWQNRWQLPAAYLRFGEHPDLAARRILEEQLEVKNYEIRGRLVKSFAAPSSTYPGETHWDICFIYDASVNEEIKAKPWFPELRFVSMSEALQLDFGRSHNEILASLGKPEV